MRYVSGSVMTRCAAGRVCDISGLTYDSQRERTGITTLLGELEKQGIAFHDLNTSQSSLEEIFVDLVHRER